MNDRTADPLPPSDVVIVGAGPVGTALACDLLQRGVTVRLIDPIEAPPEHDRHSRAILLVPRSLELLARLGVDDQLTVRGRRLTTIDYFSDGRRLGQARFDRLTGTDHPFLLALPQRQTEAVLAARLLALGGRIERGVALVALSATSPVQATLEHPDGRLESVRPRFLVGADGASSTTRRLIGQQLCGDSTDVTYLIADAPLSGPVPPERAQYHYSRRGLLAIVPLADGLCRIAGDIPHRSGHEDELAEALWRSTLQDLVRDRAAGLFAVGTPSYARTVRPRCGVADRFRVGDVVLVGDAAHVISPAGGQGLNLGFGDVGSLGPKLAGVVSGALPAETIEDYATDRRAAAIKTATATARIVRFARQPTRLRARVRDLVFVAAERTGVVQRHLTPLLSQLDGPRPGGPVRAFR